MEDAPKPCVNFDSKENKDIIIKGKTNKGNIIHMHLRNKNSE